MADFPQIFGSNLRRLRREADLRQKDLASLCDCAQGYISSLESGQFSPSMSILLRLASALGVSPAALLLEHEEPSRTAETGRSIVIVNARERGQLRTPRLEEGWVVNYDGPSFRVPGVRPDESFAAYLPDNSMAPPFGEGELLVFSLRREAADGDVALVDAAGEVVFRKVLELPDGMWRLQPNNPKYDPATIRSGRKVRMWPALGRWQRLQPGGRTRKRK